MMRRLPLVILMVGVLLVAAVTGCDRSPRYDGCLAAADSLMRSNPDSALAVVEGVCRDSLTSEGDRAYRDLLLTQARYRAYVTATSDSDINRALAYYRAHSEEREKLTRSYIYKGAVMNELGHPDSAMLYYKHAEATAAPDDYYNLGYTNLRIADLFLNEVSGDSSVIDRLHQAIDYFEKLHDTTLLISALGKLGMQCGNSDPDSAKIYLWRAISLARQSNNLQDFYTHESILAGVYLFQKEYSEANQLAMDVFRHGREYSYQNQYYYYAAMSFIKMRMVDSARMVMDAMPPPKDEVDSMALYNLTAEISKAEGQMEQYGNNLYRSNKVESDILLSSRKGNLMVIDSVFEHKQSESRKIAVIKRDKLVINVAIAFVILLSLFIFWLRRRHKVIQQSALQEKELMAKELEQALAELRKSLESEKPQMASKLLSYRMSAYQEIYQNLRFKSMDTNKVKKVVPFSSVLASMNERFELLDIQLSDSFWEKMRLSVDAEYNGIISFLENNYNSLTEKDIRVFCLLCAKVTPQIIKLCMNFANARTVSNYRNKLIKKKIGMDITFDEFIEAYLKGDLN